jgi:hypothetical protein
MSNGELKTNVEFILDYLQKQEMNAYLIVEKDGGTSSNLRIQSEYEKLAYATLFKFLLAIDNSKEEIERRLAKELNTSVKKIQQDVQALKKM